jgi:hypothetical protein
MLAGVPYTKPLLFAGLEATALLGVEQLIRATAILAIASLFVLAFRHRHVGLDG